MKKNIWLIAIVVLLIAAQAAASDWWYYRRDGSREILTPSDAFVTIKFAGQTPTPQFLHSLQAATGLTDNSDPLDVGLSFWRFAIEPGVDLQSLITALLQYPEIQLVNPVIVQNNGKLLYAFDEILLRFKSAASEPQQSDLLQSLGLTVTSPPTATAPACRRSITS